MPLPFAAMGIGALLGGLGAKQRGGNFLKGALTGAALGGVGGMLGAKFGGGGGPFGFGSKMMGWAGPMAAIGMGTEMMGQQEANLQQKLGQQRWLDEEEDRRIARLNKYAGYDVTDSKNFLTPQSYFGAARGGLAALPHYANGGFHDVPMEESGPTMDPEIMQIPMGQEGSFEEENEGIVGLELAGLTDEEMSELQALQSLSIVTPEGDPNYEKIKIRLQELMGRMKVAKGGHINRPGYFLGGLSGLLRSGKAGDMAEEMYGEELIDDKPSPAAPLWMMEEWMKRQEEKDEELEGVYDRNLEQVEDFIGDQEGFDSRSLMLGPPRGEDTEDTGASGDSNKKLRMILNALRATTPMAQGGQVNRPGYKFGGGIDWSQVTAGSNTGGFSGGPEKVWQAKTVGQNDPGLYQKGWFGGSSLTDMGQDINRMVGNRNTKGTDYFQSYPISGNREKFFEEYPNIPQTFNPFENKMSDIEEQKLLSEEAPEGYTYAQGGIADLDMRGGGESIGPGTGTSDDVPAMLSDGEFVMTANAVSNLGGGDRMLGAQRMYNMMNSLDPNSQSPGEMNVAGYG